MQAGKVFIISTPGYDEAVEKIKERLRKRYGKSAKLLYLDTVLEQGEFLENALYMTYLDDSGLRTFLNACIDQKIELAILPHKECAKALKSYNLETDLDRALENGFDPKSAQSVDLLSCNGSVVFQSVIVGDVYGLNKEVLPDDTIFTKLKRFSGNIKRLSFQNYRFKTAEGAEVETAATGVMVFEHNLKSVQSNFLNDDISLHDGKLNALILAPMSIFAYLYLLFIILFYKHFSLKQLPKSVGLIKSNTLYISASKPMDFLLDGSSLSAKEIELSVHTEALRLHLSQKAPEQVEEEGKESLQTQYLPKGEYKELLLQRSLPLFKKAGYEDFKELFTSLKTSAKNSFVYVTLMILSTLLATVGLFQNSSPVIIGAMILAPLMSPIISLSMGIVRDDAALMKSSFATLMTGVFIALFFAAVFTLSMPINPLTTQMESRLHPNILDLLVAIFSGIAGAYASAKDEIAKSLAGVAIAVALVPPLAVAGIGIGWLDLTMIQGASLLFITNLVGIMLAASLTFVVLGFAPIHRAKKGVAYTFLIVLLVTVPLGKAFYDMIWQNVTINKLGKTPALQLEKRLLPYKVTGLTQKEGVTAVEVVIFSSQALDREALLEVKRLLQKRVDTPIELEVTNKIRL